MMKSLKLKNPKMIYLVAIVAGSMLLGGADSRDSKQVSLDTLLDQMIDLEWLALRAQPGTRGIQFSSYDRNSRIEDGKKQDWFANVDIGNYLREEKTVRGTEYVMAEAEGPGAIVRFWSANAGRRVWRIYLDGSPEPVIETSGKALLGGKTRPWTEPFAGQRAMGYNFIFPIPFQDGVKVTVSRPDPMPNRPMMYYHVNLMLYPEGTHVRTFKIDQLDEYADKISRVAQVLSNPEVELSQAISSKKFSTKLEPGHRTSLAKISGPAAIRRIEITVNADSREQLSDILGRTLLSAVWDGSKKPAVSCPLGDFFGSSPGVNPMNSLPLMIKPVPGGVKLVSRWFMPFNGSADLELHNLSSFAADIKATIYYSDREPGSDTLYFNAAWREINRIPTRPESDWTLLGAHGAGRYVGTQQNVRNPLEHFWWGEGDEKIYVDGEDFPSTFGTGTEDYFGYAWCVQYISFVHAYHGISLASDTWLVVPQATGWLPWMVISEYTNKQDITSQYRFHVIDNIPFESGIKFDMEILHHRDGLVDMNATAYWYAEPAAIDDRPVLELESREVWGYNESSD